MIVRNNGGGISLPAITFQKGDKLVDQKAWAEAKKHPAVQAHLQSGRLEVLATAAAAAPSQPTPPSPTPPPEPPPEPITSAELPDAIDEDDDGVVDLSALSAKKAVEVVNTLDLGAVAKELEREDRKSVRRALERRLDDEC